MRNRSFIEDTATQALKKAHDEYGPDVIVVDTKKIKSPELGKFLVEVVVAIDDEDEEAKSNRIKHQQIKSKFDNHTAFDDEVQKSDFAREHQEEMQYELENINNHVNKLAQQKIASIQAQQAYSNEQNKKQDQANSKPQNLQIKNKPTQKIKPSPNQVPQNTQAFEDFKSQISKMQKSISMVRTTLKSGFSRQKSNNDNNLIIPPEFQSVYELFLKNELDDNLIDMIFAKTISSVPIVLKSNERKLHKFFTAIISKIIISSDEYISHNKPTVFMICGQNGSGKTSNMFKMASRYALKPNIKVACILLGEDETSHSFKSFEALALSHNIYYNVAQTPNKLREVVANLNEYDYIFLDTCNIDGSKNTDILLQYKMQIRYGTAQALLTLSANTKRKDYNAIYEAHKQLDIQSLMISNLDSTCSIGNVISFVYEHKIPISYVSWGNDFASFDVANCDFIANCFMDKESIYKKPKNKNKNNDKDNKK